MLATVLNMDLKDFCYNDEVYENSVKGEVINKINSASDIQLLFYKNSMEFVDKKSCGNKRNLSYY